MERQTSGLGLGYRIRIRIESIQVSTTSHIHYIVKSFLELLLTLEFQRSRSTEHRNVFVILTIHSRTCQELKPILSAAAHAAAHRLQLGLVPY
jgi:hypothetical protein